jgi:perosamine synthetase
MDPLLALARAHDLAVIEDAAQAIGLEYRGRPCGGLGDLSTLSFYPNKHVTTGEGGMVLADDDALGERARGLRNLCFQPPRRFVHEELGFNYRMTNLQAAIGVAQLERLDAFLAKKRRTGERYRELLRGVEGIELAADETPYARNLYWVFGVVLSDAVPFDAIEAMKRLGALGIGTRPFFYPLHRQPVFRRMGLFEGVSLPVSERLGERGLYLPSGLALTDDQIERSAAALRSVLCG